MATQKVVSPKGILEWVTITGEGKENLSGRMQYTANLVLDPKEPASAAFIQKIDKYWVDNKPKGAGAKPAYPLVKQHLEYTGKSDGEGKKEKVPSGLVYIQFKTSTTYPSGADKVIKTYNSKAQEANLGGQEIGNGTIGQIAGSLGVYSSGGNKGMSMYLDSIKITKFVSREDESGFEADTDTSDGWTGDEGWTDTED